MAARKAAITRAAKDSARPMYHFRPPARWMNDICGAIYHNGYHHIFYQSNPFADDNYGWGWGHARSKDLVHWEELPFALVPERHRGELRCNSGNVTRDGHGRPMIFFTRVPQQRGVKRDHWAATPLDDGLIHWRRVGDRPVIEAGRNGVPAGVHEGWSDPYLFREDGRTFVTFKSCNGLVCEAQNEALTEWRCIGRMENVSGECPNVFKLQDKWIILRSTHPISYVTGDLVLETNAIRFEADGAARPLDYGFGDNPPTDRTRGFTRGLYGTNAYVDDHGRRILFGWISGFKTGRGWNGCMSLPRILNRDQSGRITQTPAPELKDLRGEHTCVTGVKITSEFKRIDGAAGNQLEVIAEFAPGNAAAFGLKLRSSKDGQRGITLRHADGMLNVAGTEVPLDLGGTRKTLKLQVFLDRSVMEVFIDDGRAAVTRVEYPGEEDLTVGVFAEGGKAIVKSLDVWQMKSIW